jgi:large subunit ribosomal protein L9
VKPGYARNYLLPQGKAIHSSDAKLRELEHHKRVVAARIDAERKKMMAHRDRIQAHELEVTVQAGEEGKLFGSVTAAQIADLLEAKGVEIDRRKIALDEPIKEVGEHTVPIKLAKDIVANVKVKVIAAE